MILLKGMSLEPEVRFTPETMSLNLVDSGISTASMTLGPEAPEIALRDWLKDDTAPGKGIVWRVSSISTDYASKTRTVQLEHIAATLRDGLIFGNKDASDIAGKKAEKVSARAAVHYVLGKQKTWTLGSFEYSRSLPYSFNNLTHYAAIESVCSTLEDSRWEYDLSALPFKLSIVKKDGGNVGTEMRAGRNLQTISRTVDMSGMYTRFYPVGARNIHISGGYVSKNEDVYGVISHTETDQSKTNKDMLKEWALHRLRRHCEPTVTIAIKGLDLSQATGEALDGLTLGRVCRVPLPEFGTTIAQYIIRLSWGDKIKAPEDVTITLSNHRTDATSSLSQMLKQMSASHGANAGGGAAAAEEDHAWIVDTTDKVGLVAESIIGRDPNGGEVDWSRVSEIIVDGEGIHQRVTATEGELVVAETRIEMNEESIRLEAERAMGEEGKLSSRLTIAAEAITAEVTRATEAEGELSGRLTVQADRITAEVSRATAAEGALSGRLTVAADAITAEVSRATAAEGALSGRLTVQADRITAEVTRATEAEGTLSTNITQTAEKVGIIATDKEIEDFRKQGGTGSMLSVTKDSITSAVGRISVAEGEISAIEGSGIWQNRDSITSLAGKFRVTSHGNVQLVEGAALAVERDGIYETVGTVNYINDKVSTITGSTLWQNRNGITAVAGKMHVTNAGDLIVNEGAQLKVYSDGNLHSISQLAGKVTVTNAGNVKVQGASLYVTDDSGKSSNVTAVAGKFTVTEKGNVILEDGSGLYVNRNGTNIQVVDKGNVITSIRASAEGVKIQAAKVDLGDYATVTSLDATNADIQNLKNGSTAATLLQTKNLTVQAGGTFTFKGKVFNSSSITYVSSVSLTKPSAEWSTSHWFIYSSGRGSTDPYGVAEGRLNQSFSAGSLSVSTKTKYFLVEE